MALRPETAFLKSPDGSVRQVPAAELAVGDVVVLRPGARVPADGVIAQGHGALDEASITGESIPVSKEPGAQVFEATVNLDGVLDVTVTKPVAESTVARMIQLVTEAQAAKAPSEQFSAWFGQRYTVAVMAGATPEQRFTVFRDFCAEMREEGTANFLFTDGELLFVHAHKRRYEENGAFGEPRAPALHMRTLVPGEDHWSTEGAQMEAPGTAVLMASVPLDKEEWTGLAEGTTLLIEHGRVRCSA